MNYLLLVQVSDNNFICFTLKVLYVSKNLPLLDHYPLSWHTWWCSQCWFIWINSRKHNTRRLVFIWFLPTSALVLADCVNLINWCSLNQKMHLTLLFRFTDVYLASCFSGYFNLLSIIIADTVTTTGLWVHQCTIPLFHCQHTMRLHV